MAASSGPASRAPRQPRRGPAPFASFDHDVSDESSPESKQTFQLPEIIEDKASILPSEAKADEGEKLETNVVDTDRARSHSTSAVLQAPPAPRIDISRASSSSHHDSRDSSPELALFCGSNNEASRGQLELGFREDGTLELRSSTEELAFLETVPVESRAPPPPSRRHSRKDSQSSEAALLAISGRTSRISSVGSQCSAQSALSAISHVSHISRLSIVSGASRSPSPHKMLLETSFCGPRPIETDPEICAAAVEEKLLEIAMMGTERTEAPEFAGPLPANTCDKREVCTEVTVEVRAPSLVPTVNLVAAPTNIVESTVVTLTATDVDEEKQIKETKNRAKVEERLARPRQRQQISELKTSQIANRSKDVIRIKLKPDEEYDEDEDDESERTLISGDAMRKPATLDLTETGRRAVPKPELAPSPTPSRRRTPSPNGIPVSRKSSFCSLFKSRETIASPDSPSNVVRRKKSVNEGRSRSKSRDRSATPTSATKIKGSMLSLFKTPRKSVTSPSPMSRDGSPVIQPQRPVIHQLIEKPKHGEKLKYYEESKDGIIHIPLRTPPDEKPSSSTTQRAAIAPESRVVEVTTHCELDRPSSAAAHNHPFTINFTDIENLEITNSAGGTKKPIQRTVLPDGSIIIPLHSPTEKTNKDCNMSVNVKEALTEKVTKPLKTECISKVLDKENLCIENKRSNLLKERSVEDTRLEKSTVESPTPQNNRSKKKERILFSTHVGSAEQVFSTQLSITKTPSITSEISGSIPSFPDGDEIRPLSLRDTHITTIEAPPNNPPPENEFATTFVPTLSDEAEPSTSPHEKPRDSSESEPSSETAPPPAGNDVERRGLVVQESFEEELPYVPTTLPQERSLALPMVPVRDRGAGGIRVSGVRRPRPPAAPAAPTPLVPPAPAPSTAGPFADNPDKLRIRLPRRPRTASTPAPPRPNRMRTRSGSDAVSLERESRVQQEWIDFEEVPERRKQPKRIQTLPAAGESERHADSERVVFSYVEPDQCRCECHAIASEAREAREALDTGPSDALPSDRVRDDELPLLADTAAHLQSSDVNVECVPAEVSCSVQLQAAFSPAADRCLHQHRTHDKAVRPASAQHH